MVFMYIAPWVTAVGVKYLWGYCLDRYPTWPLEDYKLLTSVAVSLMVSLNMGIVLGFQLLEEKEQGVFKAISVTPLNHARYLSYRFALFMIVSAALAFISHEILNLYQIPTLALFLILALASIQVPIQALIISSVANNTVEGFAMMKATGFMLLVPLLANQFFVDYPISWLAGIFPYFWVIKAYQYLSDGKNGLFFIVLTIGTIYQIGAVFILYLLYRKRASN